MEVGSGSGIWGLLALKGVCCIGLILAASGGFSGLSVWLSDGRLPLLGAVGLFLLAGIGLVSYRRCGRKTEISKTTGLIEDPKNDAATVRPTNIVGSP